MTDDPTTLDAELAAFRRLEADLARAIAACQAVHTRGETGYAEYLSAKAAQERLLAAGTALSGRISEALRVLAPTSAVRDNDRREVNR